MYSSTVGLFFCSRRLISNRSSRVVESDLNTFCAAIYLWLVLQVAVDYAAQKQIKTRR